MHQIRLMPDSYPASLCPYALMLIAYMRNSKKSFYSLIRLRFEPGTNRTRCDHTNHYTSDTIH